MSIQAGDTGWWEKKLKRTDIWSLEARARSLNFALCRIGSHWNGLWRGIVYDLRFTMTLWLATYTKISWSWGVVNKNGFYKSIKWALWSTLLRNFAFSDECQHSLPGRQCLSQVQIYQNPEPQMNLFSLNLLQKCL